MPASPCIMPSNPTQSMRQLQALHGNGVMLWILCVPTHRPDTERHYACAQRGTPNETFFLHLLKWQRRVGIICFRVGFEMIIT
jgi:hypothetical protein